MSRLTITETAYEQEWILRVTGPIANKGHRKRMGKTPLTEPESQSRGGKDKGFWVEMMYTRKYPAVICIGGGVESKLAIKFQRWVSVSD